MYSVFIVFVSLMQNNCENYGQKIYKLECNCTMSFGKIS